MQSRGGKPRRTGTGAAFRSEPFPFNRAVLAVAGEVVPGRPASARN